MATFDLSLAVGKPTTGDVQASKKYDKTLDAKTGQIVKETVSEGANTINKSKAPKLMLDGPVGHLCTQLLNRELSLESMSAVVLAADHASEYEEDAPNDPGKVQVTEQGASVMTPNDSTGYIYVVSADTLESSALSEISQKFIDHRRSDPNKQLGLALLTDGSPTSTVEALVNCLESLNVRTTFRKSGLVDMAKTMLGSK